MMGEHGNGYGRYVRNHRDEHDDRGYGGHDDGGGYGGRDEHRYRSDESSSRYDDDAMPFASRTSPRRLKGNTVASVWEVTAQSRTSFDDAIRYGIERARRTLRHIRGAWVQGQEVLIRDNEIYAYRVQLKITYVLDDT